MANGTLKLYNKLTNALLVSLDILGTFNIEDNLNETPSNMKVKVITSNTYREEFEVNTVAFHEDTNSWWVIKSDESSYLTTGEYEHEIQLVEYLEFYAYRHLPNCAFAPNTYTLEQMLLRLFNIAKLLIVVEYPNFLDKNKIMPFFSFENFTVANAIKNISRAINAIPKMSYKYGYVDSGKPLTVNSAEPSSPSNSDYWFNPTNTSLYQFASGNWFLIPNSTFGSTTPAYGDEPGLFFVNTATLQVFFTTTLLPILTFVNRNGADNAIVNVLDTQFPIAYEKNMNSSDQFTTRSVSNITNAKSGSLVVSPKSGGYKNIVENSLEYNNANSGASRVYLPSKIDKIEFVRLYTPVIVSRFIVGSSTSSKLFEGYYIDEQTVKNAIISKVGEFTRFTLSDLQALTMPDSEVIHQINLNDTLGTSFPNTFFRGLHTLKSKFDFDTSDKLTGDYNTIEKVKDKTIHWLPFSNELVLGKTIREGMTIPFSGANHYRNIVIAQKTASGTTEQIRIEPILRTVGFFNNRLAIDELLVQVGYYPIADIKVSIDNDNDAQDEKFFNQTGKVIDAISVSKLITSHTNDSVEGTKIRNARYTSLSSILPVGQLVRDNNQIYIITQRSIDGQIKSNNEHYNVIYTLSRNRVARSENIVADSSVISYKTPDDNLVSRTQLYKDYIELSLVNQNQDSPYLIMTKALVLSNTLAGTNFDYTVLARNQFSSSTVRYVKNPTTFDLHKSKLVNVNWQSNNLLGYRLDSIGLSYVQTPILYTDSLGKATNFELLFLDTNNLETAKSSFNTAFSGKADDLIPFRDLTQVDVDYYTTSVLANGRFSIRIQEDTSGGKPYNKDPFEIPVFEYMIQGNDDYTSIGNIVVSNDLFTTFTGNITYHYLINNGNRFTAENAEKILFSSGLNSEFDRRAVIDRSTNTQFDLDLFSNFSTSARNSTAITNVGFYAIDWGTLQTKFLFAINDYVVSGINDNSNIRVFINNWKI
jgi:hypothetical protein